MTDVGAWTQRRLGEIATMGSGGTPSSAVARYYGGSIPWVSIADMTTSGKYVRRTTKTLTEAGLAASAAKLYDPGVVLYAMYASLGECAIATGRMSSSQAILGIKPGAELDRDFLYYYLESIKPLVKTLGQHGTQANLNAGMVRDFRLPLPPLDAQRRIASVLCDADELIATLEGSIAKRRAMKQGMMQQLLTGCTRLPGFDAAWVVGPLKSFLPLQRGFDLPNSSVRPGPYPVVYSNGVARMHAVAMAEGPGVVTGRSGTIGKVHYIEGDYWPHNTSLWVTSFARVDAKFAYYFLTYLGLERFASGSGVPTFNRNDAHTFEVHLPGDRAEQRAIATVLSDLDTDLELVKRRLGKARLIKQGLMQQLLTGRTRLPVEAAL